jgi:hypothetical protein
MNSEQNKDVVGEGANHDTRGAYAPQKDFSLASV